MRKLSVVLPLLLVLAPSCDSTRRDFSVCDRLYAECQKGFVCDVDAGLCVLAVDAAIPDTRVVDDGNPVDLSSSEANVPDAKDAPVAIDAAPVDMAVLDTSIIDVPQPVDLPAPDTRVPDAAGSCSVDSDCIGVAGGNYCVNARCVACKASSQCNNDAGVPFCSAQNTCVSCKSISGPDGGSACPASAPVCESTSGRCVECVKNSDCPTVGKGFCVQNQCKGCDAVGATAAAGGSDGGASDGGASGPCTGSTTLCVPSTSTSPKAGQCVGCASSADCSGTTPICDTTTAFTCAACTSDTQCAAKAGGPGICMFHQATANGGGRCASDAETIYVQNAAGSAGCSGGVGTSVSPYCRSQDGINAVTSSKRVVVMRGTVALGVWVASFSGSQVFGQNGATVTPGADIGVHISSGDVYIRGLTVQGSASAVNAGIVVDSGATVRLDRCIVTDNVGGLLVHNGAGFEVANSVFAANQAAVGDFGAFGGVALGNTGTGLPSRFWFNTVVDNQAQGVVCTTNTQSLDGVLLWMNTGGDQVHCTMATSSKSGANDVRDPQLSTTAPYHLTTASPCKDFVDATVTHPADDIDGDSRPRPATGKLDCGADEF